MLQGFAPLPPLEASFDGKGYAISNLYIHKEGDHVGLFSQAGKVTGVTIKNLDLKSIRVHNTKTSGVPGTGGMIGGLVNHIAISESSVTGEISGSGNVGGMLGHSDDKAITIKNSYTDVTVTGTKFVGGIIGVLGAGSSIDNSHSRGSATRTGTGYGGVGGLAGGLGDTGAIYNSYSHASVSGVYSVGSLIGLLSDDAVLSNSYGVGAVEGTSTTKKGIAGTVGGSVTLTDNFWDTETTGEAVDADQGTGLTTSGMKVSCAGSNAGICALGSAFVFTQGSYPKIKKCESGCNTGSPTLSDDLVIGQD